MLLAESLERLDASEWIDAIVVAVPPDWEEPAIVLAEELVASKVAAVVTGWRDARRVRSGRARGGARTSALVVIVHDAARPLVDDAVIERVLGPLAEGVDGVVPGLPLADTVKRVERGLVAETIDRYRARHGADAPGVHRRPRSGRVPRRRPARRDGLRLAGRGARGADPRRRGRPAAPEGDDSRRPRPRRVVALKAVFFDVGETLVDEERWWRDARERSGLQPHVVWAALGVTIERGEEHCELWSHLGIERPDGWWNELAYQLDDLYPDALECLGAVRLLGLRVGIAATRPRRSSAWAREAELPVDVITSSASLGVRKPDPAFFERLVELAGCAPGGGRLRRRPGRQRRAARRCAPGWSRSTCAAARGGGSSARRRRQPSASTTSRRCRRASLARS